MFIHLTHNNHINNSNHGHSSSHLRSLLDKDVELVALVDIAVRRRVLGADVIVGDLAEALVLVQAGSRDEVLHVAEVGAVVEMGIPGLRGRISLKEDKLCHECNSCLKT